MKEAKSFTKLQTASLVILRFLIGWHILYEGFAKLLIPNWSSSGFLQESKWILTGITHWIISHSSVLNAVDFLNTWGLIAIGTGLILGLFTRPAAIAGTILLLVYYACTPPLIGLEYAIPMEGSNLIVNKTLIESAALFTVALFPTSYVFGLDVFIGKYKNLRKSK
jgi:thiosulfate dehydrogenase (quinone) large subunit